MNSKVSTIRMTAIAAALTLGLGACSDLSNTQERTLSGGAIGAGVGAVGTVVTGGCVACGAAVGGAVGGYLMRVRIGLISLILINLPTRRSPTSRPASLISIVIRGRP